MRILYCGPHLSETAIQEKRSVSQAGVRWSVEFVSALRQLGHEVIVISHVTEQLWPKGPVFWQNNDPKWFYDKDCIRISYLNVPLVRRLWLNFRYAQEAVRVAKVKKLDAFLCYNSLHPHHVETMRAMRRIGVPCYPIVLDGDDPRLDNWQAMRSNNRFASGIVFLSYWLHQHYPLGIPCGGKLPVYQLDGGSTAFNGVMPKTDTTGAHRLTVMHTGSLSKTAELGFLADALKQYKDKNTRFIFTGRVNKKDVDEMCGNDPRIEVKGFIPKDELNRLCLEADAFVSARMPDTAKGHSDNVVNFPSKLPQMLSWGRPVVSTWVGCFSPDYRDVLYLADDNTPAGMAAQLERVRQMSLVERQEYFGRAKDWFERKKTWKAQVAGLSDWIESLAK